MLKECLSFHCPVLYYTVSSHLLTRNSPLSKSIFLNTQAPSKIVVGEGDLSSMIHIETWLWASGREGFYY